MDILRSLGSATSLAHSIILLDMKPTPHSDFSAGTTEKIIFLHRKVKQEDIILNPHVVKHTHNDEF